ncbi:hypothetical protein [Polyangium sp. 6x1]|uniref:hypothetical protein n=1 Tax=Polyangium sp. 6x1 TaxID=3042689 RepID=UPI002482CA70|nr:hypothetical protein [Polyangium sp. 6x1]MDI1446009.1 hypothetical protein [Polyangium sp. 6x1]
MRRSLIHSLDLPRGSDARALAESLVGPFAVASISGSDGAYEVQFVNPSSLVAVIGPSHARFFVQEVEMDAADEDEEAAEGEGDEEDEPHDIAEAVSHHLARSVGLTNDDEDTEDTPPADESDRLARHVIAQLLEGGLLELTSPRSRAHVEARLAYCFERGMRGSALIETLTEVPGVAEIYASDEELSALIAQGRRAVPRTPRPR